MSRVRLSDSQRQILLALSNGGYLEIVAYVRAKLVDQDMKFLAIPHFRTFNGLWTRCLIEPINVMASGKRPCVQYFGITEAGRSALEVSP